jgi:hypothetical protein
LVIFPIEKFNREGEAMAPESPVTNRLRIGPSFAAMRILRAGDALCSSYPAEMDSMFQVVEIFVKGLGKNIK